MLWPFTLNLTARWASIERIHFEIGTGAGFLSALGKRSAEWDDIEEFGIFIEWIGDRISELCESAAADFKKYADSQETKA
jgi:hypothetical protein